MRYVLFAILIFGFLFVGLPAHAQSGSYSLTWHSVGVSAGSSGGGGYDLAMTAGQAEAGQANGGGYTLSGGYWAAGPVVEAVPPAGDERIFLPLIVK